MQTNNESMQSELENLRQQTEEICLRPARRWIIGGFMFAAFLCFLNGSYLNMLMCFAMAGIYNLLIKKNFQRYKDIIDGGDVINCRIEHRKRLFFVHYILSTPQGGTVKTKISTYMEGHLNNPKEGDTLPFFYKGYPSKVAFPVLQEPKKG